TARRAKRTPRASGISGGDGSCSCNDSLARRLEQAMRDRASAATRRPVMHLARAFASPRAERARGVERAQTRSSAGGPMDPLSIYQWLYEKTDGRFTWLGGLPVLLLRTIGRKSRTERTAALVYLQDGNDLVVVASNGGSDKPPGWFFNLQASPEVGVQI